MHQSIYQLLTYQPKQFITATKKRAYITAFEVKCHSDNAALLKFIICKTTANDNMFTGNDIIHFVVYELLQDTSSDLYRSQIINHNSFLHNL